LQEGGKEVQPQIAAGDKDLKPTFNKLIELCTKDVFFEFARIGGVDVLYDEKDAAELSAYKVEDFLDDVYLEDVFGNNSRIPHDIWQKQTAGIGSYVLSASTLRSKYLEKAGIPFKY
jgi:hypothetical protein